MAPQQATVESDPVAVAKRIGEEYVEWSFLPQENARVTKRAYARIADTVSDLFEEIQIPVEFQAEDPYDDYRDMRETVGAEGVLRIYNQHTDHEYFSHEEQLKFRAVHDWHGHLDADVDFSPTGEFKKWEHMNQYFDIAVDRKVMFAEVVGQVGAVHYLPDGFADDRYKQRAFVAPRRWIDWMSHAVDG